MARDVFTVRAYGTRQLLGTRLVRTSSHHNPRNHRSATRKITQDMIVAQVSHWVLAAWGSRETGGGVMAAGGHGPGLGRQVCCPCAGRRRDRFQGGGCRAGCPAGVSRGLR
jgi:hypothetical protein